MLLASNELGFQILFRSLSGFKLFNCVNLVNMFETKRCHNTECHNLNFQCSIDLEIYTHSSCNIFQGHPKPDTL
jgi:hypothetical protein